jgi:hypothetical protein
VTLTVLLTGDSDSAGGVGGPYMSEVVDLSVGRLAVVLPDAGMPGGPCLVVEMVSGADGEYGPAEEDRPE